MRNPNRKNPLNSSIDNIKRVWDLGLVYPTKPTTPFPVSLGLLQSLICISWIGLQPITFPNGPLFFMFSTLGLIWAFPMIFYFFEMVKNNYAVELRAWTHAPGKWRGTIPPNTIIMFLKFYPSILIWISWISYIYIYIYMSSPLTKLFHFLSIRYLENLVNW